jgi:hypothetical protein
MSKKKLGVSATPPVNEASFGTKSLSNLLRLPRGKKAKRIEKQNTKKDVDNTAAVEVSSSQVENDSADAMTQQRTDNTTQKARPIMSVTLTKDTKARKSSSIVYTGAGLRSGVRIAKSAFKDGVAPDTLVIESDAFAEAKQPRAKMTAEERKAARANAPKLTLAEKIAKREKQLADLKAKAAAQPSL